ncbi:hypothetical protein HA402_014830 [Bradysia odoriphaga]|nr:hypothetical protein HA402_014830 [Bradysia odoriphaga]
MIVADIEIRSGESGANENVIDLSLDDDVPSNSHDVDKRYGDDRTKQDSTCDNQYTRKELLLREKLGRCGEGLTNDQSNTKPNTVSQNNVENDNLKVIKSNKMQISPGEPVPPGFEDLVKPVAELQVILSKYRTSPMLGLEYVIELIMGDRRPRTYHCALCDLICDTKDIIDHIKSYEHRCKYLEKHFSTVMVSLSQYRHHKSAKNVLAGVVEAVCDSIEDAYGRMVPSVFENNDYTTNRAIYMKRLAGERHFDEKSGSTFVGVVDHKAIQSAFEKLAETTKNKAVNVVAKRPRVDTSTRGKRSSFDSISSSDSVTASFKRKISNATKAVDSIEVEQINLDLISSDSDDDSSARRRKNSSSRRSSSYIRDDETEDHKYERYRAMTEKAVRHATNLLQEYEKYPEKHPMYPSEWKRYWTRRSKELEAAGRDPSNFDFSPEWSKYWLRRLRELYEDEISLKKFEIRKKLNLSADYYPRSSSYSYNDQPTASSSSYRYDKEESRMQTQYATETVSEDTTDDEPLTVISVLRLLAALEDQLGATLGKKVLDLLSKAVHLEKLKANLADDVLMNEENSVLLDTVKEKLKGLIIAKIVNNQQINAVRRAIRNVESIVAIIDKKISVSKVRDEPPPNSSDKKEVSNDRSWTENPKTSPTESERRNESLIEVSKQIATAFLIQKMNISKERLEELTDKLCQSIERFGRNTISVWCAYESKRIRLFSKNRTVAFLIAFSIIISLAAIVSRTCTTTASEQTTKFNGGRKWLCVQFVQQ